MEQNMLREQNYQLKNQITDLKNAFDLNRDILKIVSNYNKHPDAQFHVLLQIINRLTTVNNHAMLNSIDHLQQKNILKKQNLRLNLEMNKMEAKLQRQIQINRVNNLPNESKFVMHEQFNSINKEIMAANEERIIKEHEIQYWKQMYTNSSKDQISKQDLSMEEIKQKIKRRYTSNPGFKQDLLYRELEKENRKLKRYIDQLQNRLLVIMKAINLEDDSQYNNHSKHTLPSLQQFHDFEEKRDQIRLLKYALNNIQVEKRDDQYILTVTQRFKEKDPMNNQYIKDRRSSSWPKHQNIIQEEEHISKDKKQKYRTKMEQRQY